MIRLERTSYTYDDKCARIRLKRVQERSKQENMVSDEKIREIFDNLGVDIDSIKI